MFILHSYWLLLVYEKIDKNSWRQTCIACMLEIAERVSILWWVIDWTYNGLKLSIYIALNISNTGDSSYTAGLIYRNASLRDIYHTRIWPVYFCPKQNYTTKFIERNHRTHAYCSLVVALHYVTNTDSYAVYVLQDYSLDITKIDKKQSEKISSYNCNTSNWKWVTFTPSGPMKR